MPQRESVKITLPVKLIEYMDIARGKSSRSFFLESLLSAKFGESEPKNSEQPHAEVIREALPSSSQEPPAPGDADYDSSVHCEMVWKSGADPEQECPSCGYAAKEHRRSGLRLDALEQQ